MTEQHDDSAMQSMSALMDDEHNELDLRRVLKSAETDDSVLNKWRRYHMARQVMQKEDGLIFNTDFASRVSAAIEQEPSYHENTATRVVQRIKRMSSQIGVAACVSFAVLIGATQWQVNEAPNTDSNTQGHETLAVVPEGFELPPLTARTVSGMPNVSGSPVAISSPSVASSRPEVLKPSAELESLIGRQMYKHAQSASANGGLGVLPLMRIAVSLQNGDEE